MKFGHVIEHQEQILKKSHSENETGRLVSDLFLFSKKALYLAKASGL